MSQAKFAMTMMTPIRSIDRNDVGFRNESRSAKGCDAPEREGGIGRRSSGSANRPLKEFIAISRVESQALACALHVIDAVRCSCARADLP